MLFRGRVWRCHAPILECTCLVGRLLISSQAEPLAEAESRAPPGKASEGKGWAPAEADDSSSSDDASQQADELDDKNPLCPCSMCGRARLGLEDNSQILMYVCVCVCAATSRLLCLGFVCFYMNHID